MRSAVASLLLAAMALSSRVCAHTLPISYLYVVPDADYMHLELMLNPFELSFFSELDVNKDGRLDPAELQGQQEALTRRVLDCLKLRVAGKPVTAEVAGITPEVDGHHLTLRAQYHIDARSTPLELESSLSTITSGSHLTQVTYLRAGRRQLAQLDTQSAKVIFEPFEKPAQAAATTSRSSRLTLSVAVFLLLAIPGLTVLAVGGWRSRRQTQETAPALR
jgi:hypothetical protein